jgi:hypothetical protein
MLPTSAALMYLVFLRILLISVFDGVVQMAMTQLDDYQCSK